MLPGNSDPLCRPPSSGSGSGRVGGRRQPQKLSRAVLHLLCLSSGAHGSFGCADWSSRSRYVPYVFLRDNGAELYRTDDEVHDGCCVVVTAGGVVCAERQSYAPAVHVECVECSRCVVETIGMSRKWIMMTSGSDVVARIKPLARSDPAAGLVSSRDHNGHQQTTTESRHTHPCIPTRVQNTTARTETISTIHRTRTKKTQPPIHPFRQNSRVQTSPAYLDGQIYQSDWCQEDRGTPNSRSRGRARSC